ncbi:MAG: PAS domain S-box protein [Nitrospirae bacterium]|nr:PAS domain S-box protein [Nitrospirota bacterium]
MQQNEPVAILLINEIAEEIKLVTLSFRGFFPGCRVEAVYSLEEALQWAPRASWHLILIDERLLAQRSIPLFPELKRLAPYAALVLQTDRSDSTAALNTLQAGADFLLYKKSPAFLTELVLYTRDALEKRELRATLERTQERHGRLVESLADVLYELDAEGRFVYLSPLITELLGYTPEELTGSPYSTVIPPDQLDRARYRFNDRRTGTRASRRIEVELARKASHDKPASTRVRAEVSSKGLYDPQRRYRGTLGLLRDMSRHRSQEEAIHHLEQQLRETDRLIAIAQRLSTLSKHLRAPHTAVLAQSQQLLEAIREARLAEQVESLMLHATEAVRLGEELAQAATEVGVQRDTINDIIDTVLATTQPPLLNTDQIERAYASNLPPFTGSLPPTTQLLRILLSHAQRYVTAVGSHHRLRISTAAIGPTGARIEAVPTLFPPMPPAEVEIHLEEIAVVTTEQGPPLQETADLFEAYALIKQLGGRLDFLAPVGGMLSIKIWIPVEPAPETRGPLAPPSPPVSPATTPAAASPSNPPPPPPAPAALPITRLPPTHQPPQPLPDRRNRVRVSVHFPARITVGNAMYDGTVTNLGLGGAGLVVEGLLPSVEQQPAYVILKTAVGILELQATAHERGETLRRTNAEPQNSRLAFRFASHNNIEQQVLASFIDEAREHTFSLTLEALLSLPDDAADPTSTFGETDRRSTDRREAVRARVALPFRTDTPSLDATAHRPLGLVINFSRSGACVQMEQAPGIVDDVIALHFSTTGSLDQPRTHEPEMPEAILTARIIWTAPDPTVPSELKPGPSQPGQRIGIRFAQLTPFAEREINRVVAQHIGSSMDLEGIAGRSLIISARRECRNARQQVIAVTDDHARHQISPSTPVVVIVPGFGQTQTDYLPLSFYLAANRFRALRYDHTNHVGQSDGDILLTTLRSMEVDLQNVLKFARTTWPTAPLTILAEDIAARVALKVMARSQEAGHLLLLNPVLDVQTALSITYRHDVIADHQHGLRRGVANLWGLNVNLDQFISDALAGEYASLGTTTTDLAALATPPIILTSPRNNRPVEHTFGPLGRALRALGTAPVVVPLQADVSYESSVHDERHSSAFRMIFNQISAVTTSNPPSIQMREPAARDIHHQQQLEQERIRIRHHVSQATRDALWVARLAQLPQLGNLPDYWALENELYRRLLPLESGMTVLDFGCGQGDLARVMLTNQAYRLIHQGGPPAGPVHYIGLGQSHESLRVAERHVRTFARELTTTFTAAVSPAQLVEARWLRSDWESPLPFMEHSIERVLYHLSLPFTPSPLNCLRQALRALHPEGAIVLTCFQPHTDLSPLFRHHLRTSGQDEFSAPTQIVLHYLGRLREAIRHGLLHSYEQNELARLLIHAGARPLRIVPVLDSQLLLAVVQKAKSAG